MLSSIRGAFLGAACADALGFRTVGMTPPAIRARFGPNLKEFTATSGPTGVLRITAETHLMLSVAESLSASPSSFANDLVRSLQRWANSQAATHHPSRTFVRAARILASTEPDDDGVRRSHLPGVDGEGASRAVPVGLAYANDQELCTQLALSLAGVTHSAPLIRAGYITVANAARLLLLGIHPRELPERLSGQVGPMSEELGESLSMVCTCADLDSEAAFNCLGTSDDLSAVIARAFYCLFRYPDDFEDAVLLSIGCGGKSTATSCLVGALAGCRAGIEAIPGAWLNSVAEFDLVDEKAVSFHAVLVAASTSQAPDSVRPASSGRGDGNLPTAEE